MRVRARHVALIPALAVLALCARSAVATTIQELTWMRGHERIVLTGMGIVIGLNGTGDDSRDSLIAARPYARLLENLGYPITDISELADMDSYAIVMVTLNVPPTGAADGERFDVAVEAMFNATSLKGGRLIVSPLRIPRPDSPDLEPYAFADGQLIIEDDSNERSAKIRSGAQMITSFRTNPVSPSGQLTLVLQDEYAGYPNATLVAESINDEFAIDGHSNVASVIDGKHVRIVVPRPDRADPAAFIAAMQTIRIDPSLIRTEARIVINERKGIIVVTGNVYIGPVAVRAAGLSITSITPPPTPTVDDPIARTTEWANVDASDGQTRSSTRLRDLLDALEQLKVPVGDQIAIIFEMRKTGALHAEIISQ